MILQWLKKKLMQRAFKTKHNVVRLNFKKAELEKLLAQKDKMTPEEFRNAYNKLIK